jgi:hypothetical protein
MKQDDVVDPTPLERTARSRAWLLPALGVAIVLGGVIYLGRSGIDSPRPTLMTTPAPIVALGPTPSASAYEQPVPTAIVLPEPQPETGPAGLVSEFGQRSGGLRFVDGLPTSYDGTPVLRVADALRLPAGTAVLVGGWYHSTPCHVDSLACASPTLSDDPAGSPRRASMIVTGTQLWLGELGPRILQGTTTQTSSCPTHDNLACSLWLDAASMVWTGDPLTDADPLAPISILGSLSHAFPDMDFQPFLEATSCPVSWPSQTYLATVASVSRAATTSLPVRLVMLFPSTVERIDTGRDIQLAAENLSSFDAANRCVGLSAGVSADSWLARKNVLVLLGDNDAAVTQEVRTALAAAN